MPPTVLTGIVTNAGVMAKTVTMTVRKVKTHPKPVSYTHLTLPTTPYV